MSDVDWNWVFGPVETFAADVDDSGIHLGIDRDGDPVVQINGYAGTLNPNTIQAWLKEVEFPDD